MKSLTFTILSMVAVAKVVAVEEAIVDVVNELGTARQLKATALPSLDDTYGASLLVLVPLYILRSYRSP